MLPPLPRCSSWAYSSLISPNRVSLPQKGRRVGLHIDIFEACSAFTRVAACTLALSPIRDTLIEGFSHFVTSMTAPIASGWSESPGGACTHWKAPPCHGAPTKLPFVTAAKVAELWKAALAIPTDFVVLSVVTGDPRSGSAFRICHSNGKQPGPSLFPRRQRPDITAGDR